MAEMTKAVPNFRTINGFMEELDQEYDLSSRLSRYESMSPELVEFAQNEGLSNPQDAIHALFVADFVITSSEVASGVSDEDRRRSIIKVFVSGLKNRTDSSEQILRAFYLTQKVYIACKRNDAFMAGRGVEGEDRKQMLLDLFLLPYLGIIQNILGSHAINWELGIFHSMIGQEVPHHFVDRYLNLPPLKTGEAQTTKTLWNIVDEFVSLQDAELNPDSPLPNIIDTSVIFQATYKKKVHLAVSNTKASVTSESLVLNEELAKFLDQNDKTNALIYVRSKLLTSQKHLMLVRDPFTDGKPMALLKSPVSDLNVTEVSQVLDLRSQQLAGVTQLSNIHSIDKITIDTVIKEVAEIKEREIEEEITEEVPVEAPAEEEKKVGFFGRIKRALFGSSDESSKSTNKPKTKQVKKKQVRTVQEEVTKQVEEEVKRSEQVGVHLPEFVAHSLGLYAVEDLRLFEEFDTLRETEYQIIGVLESDFVNNTTTLLSTARMEDSEQIFTMLDGLDHVIEQVANYYFQEEHQVIPTEMLFLSQDHKHFILCLDGNDKGLVATIAKTYAKDITNWQQKEQVDSVQRRTLHMRTGQLLSAREHTPFDRAAERIYSSSLGEETSISKIDHALLSLSD